MEAGTVELEVSWKLNHKPETPAAQKVQVEEESGLSQQDVLPDPPALWELWLPLPQTEGQLCVLRSNDLDSSEVPRLQKAEPVSSLCTHLTSSRCSIVCKNALV